MKLLFWKDKIMRLNKYLSDAGVCSRREADRLTEAGEITVNGKRAETGMQVEPGDVVVVKGKTVVPEEKKVYLAFNKPRGIVCTAEKREKNNVIDYLSYPVRIYPVGRLDKDSEGLLLMTNDGAIVNGIMRARNRHEKEYQVEVNKEITPEFLKKMASGVPILDTVTRPCRIQKTGERSFTIIAYPVPEIGEKFKEIFAETVKINTLDYTLYQNMQQKIIDVLDQAEKVHITGKNGNKTDLYVSIWSLKDATKESAFENCVADVNIPVGEVFTSPVLKGTTGKLFVSQVYLNELKYLNLEIDFEDGMIRDYTCTNFEKEEECRKYIKENVLMNHETLPMGEFAIGTNTTAYRMARDFDIADKLPILIAEKTGPHFAVGDTCYSHEEDMVTYNPDGKQIVARENDFSKLRSEDMSKAYFNCHTDITIPYDELDKITVIRKDGTTEDIISDGRFVLAGIEELNKPLDR